MNQQSLKYFGVLLFILANTACAPQGFDGLEKGVADAASTISASTQETPAPSPSPSNSYIQEQNISIVLSKSSYAKLETIKVTVSGVTAMFGATACLFREGSTDFTPIDWDSVVETRVNEITFSGQPVGSYEIRVSTTNSANGLCPASSSKVHFTVFETGIYGEDAFDSRSVSRDPVPNIPDYFISTGSSLGAVITLPRYENAKLLYWGVGPSIPGIRVDLNASTTDNVYIRFTGVALQPGTYLMRLGRSGGESAAPGSIGFKNFKVYVTGTAITDTTCRGAKPSDPNGWIALGWSDFAREGITTEWTYRPYEQVFGPAGTGLPPCVWTCPETFTRNGLSCLPPAN